MNGHTLFSRGEGQLATNQFVGVAGTPLVLLAIAEARESPSESPPQRSGQGLFSCHIAKARASWR